MAGKNQVYKCTIFGNTVEVVQSEIGKFSCFGQLMVFLKDDKAKADKDQ